MRTAPKGFTITEVLIFLAISGVMFIIAYLGLWNQQDSVRFRQALNGVELKVREIFNNVDNGYFGNIGEYTCSSLGVPTYEVSIEYTPDGTAGGGTSGDCVFIGKTIDFNESDAQMSIATLVGSRQAPELVFGTSLIEVASLSETYDLTNAVKWSGSYIYNADTKQYNQADGLRVSAQRDRNSNAASLADLRANRSYYVGGSWQNVSNTNLPMYCFSLGDSKGSIIITQKDVTVDYSGEGCL